MKYKQKKVIARTINSSELDFLTLIEHGIRPPIAFKSKKYLDDWTKKNGLKNIKLGKRDEEEDVVLIKGKIEVWGYEGGLSYRQIWASVNYRKYRNAIGFYVKTVEGDFVTISFHDADHAVSQTRLANEWEDAWVNMLLIESGLNKSVGAMMEKAPLKLEDTQTNILINAECIIKTFYKKTGTLSEDSAGQYLTEASCRFINHVNTLNLDSALDTFGMSSNATEILNEIASEYLPDLNVRDPVSIIIISDIK